MNNTALQLSQTGTTMNDWQMIREQAAVLVTTGFLPKSITSPEQAMAIILTGRELGIGPMAALQGIDVIQGKPSISPQLMLAMVNGTGQVEDIKVETGVDGATVTIKRKGRSAYTTTFGPKEARAMALDGKDNYKKQPAVMYQWRAIGANLRVTFPDVIKGMYTMHDSDGTPDTGADFIEAESLEEDAPKVEIAGSATVEPPAGDARKKTIADIYSGFEKIRADFKVSADAVESRIAQAAGGQIGELEEMEDDQLTAILASLRTWYGELSKAKKGAK